MKYCFACGLYEQGLAHDLSKYSPSEFWRGVKYYQGYRSPNDAERRENGVSLAWLHHKGRNRHHFEYWIDYCIADDGKVYMGGCKMPLRYVAEMFCDRIAACRVYQKEKYTDASPWEYYQRSKNLKHTDAGRYMHADTAALLERRIPALHAQLEQAISGASVDAGDWAGGVLRKLVRSEVQAQLPEFKPAVDVLQEDGRTVVQVVIYPVGQLVRNIRYELRSEAIPNVLLMQMKYKYAGECDKLRGLPVAYVQRHRQELEQQLLEKLMTEPEVKNYQLRPEVKITPGADLGVNIMIESDDYKIWFEGYGDIGRDNENLSGKAHLGKMISPRDEIFGEAEVILDDVQWRFGTGYTHYWGKSGWSYVGRIPIGDNNYRLEYSLSPKWRLRAEHFSGDNRNEFAVRYRIHEFLSAEYVYGGSEFYLRLIGNL